MTYAKFLYVISTWKCGSFE